MVTTYLAKHILTKICNNIAQNGGHLTFGGREVDRILEDYLNPEPFDPGACTRGLYLRGVE